MTPDHPAPASQGAEKGDCTRCDGYYWVPDRDGEPVPCPRCYPSFHRPAPASQEAETPPRFECDGPDWCGVCDLCTERAMQEDEERADADAGRRPPCEGEEQSEAWAYNAGYEAGLAAAVSREDGGDERPTMPDVIRRAKDELARLCAGRGRMTQRGLAGRDWTMCVPVRPHDSDVIFMDLIEAAAKWEREAAASRSRVAALEADAERWRYVRERLWVRRAPALSGPARPCLQIAIGRSFLPDDTPSAHRPDKVDAAIDAARSAQQEGRETRSPEGDPRDR